MGRLNLLLCGATAAVVVACSNSTSPTKRSYNVTFHQDSAQSYSTPFETPSCTLGDLYGCKVWVTGSAEFEGILDASAATIRLATDTTLFYGSDVHFDSLPNSFNHTFVCGGFQIRAAVEAGVLRGVWTQSMDCHGRTRTGTLLSH